MVGREVNFGIRPEDLYDRLFYNYPVSDGSSVKAVVDVVEPMGSEIYLYLEPAPWIWSFGYPPYVKAEAGRTMDLVFNLEQMHLFDRGTGQSLLKPIAAPALPPRPTAAASALP